MRPFSTNGESSSTVIIAWSESVRMGRYSPSYNPSIAPSRPEGSPHIRTTPSHSFSPSETVPGGLPGEPIPDGGETGVSESAVEEFHTVVTTPETKAIIDSLPVGILLVDGEGLIVAANRTVREETGYTGSELLGRPIEDILEWEAHNTAIGGEGPGSSQDVGDRERWGQVGLLRTVAQEIPVSVSVTRRNGESPSSGSVITYRLEEPERADRRRRRRERLGVINQFNTILRKVTRSIIFSTHRNRLEEEVCEELAAATPYEFVMIAERGAEEDTTVVPRAWAGIEEDLLKEMLAAADDDGEEACPISAALSTRTVTTETGIDRNPAIQQCFSGATDLEISSVAVAPIQYRDRVYGVLAVYSGRSDSFEDYEVGMLQDLGAIIGFVYNAIDNQEVLVSDTVVELEFEIRNRESFFAATSAAENCTIEVEKAVRDADGELLYFHRMDGIAPDRMLELAADAPYIEDIEIVRERGDQVWTVSRLTRPSVVEMLAVNNVRVKRIVAEDGVVRLVVQLRPDTDTAVATDILDSVFEEYELVAKRRRDRGSPPVQHVYDDVFDRLTEKQRDAVVTAAECGYFERPRERTIEEIADQLGLAPSTYHQHLQSGLRKLVYGLIEAQSEYRPDRS